MKFLKYFFYALLPIMLLMMFFSYNNFSFIGAKAGASSTTNTINFYGKDNYLIGSYKVPNGQSINDTVITTTDTISNNLIFNALSTDTLSHKFTARNAWLHNSSFINHTYSVYFFPNSASPSLNIFAQLAEGYALPIDITSDFTLSLKLSNVNLTNLININTSRSRVFASLSAFTPNYYDGNVPYLNYTLFEWVTFDNLSSLNDFTTEVNAKYEPGFIYYLFFSFQVMPNTTTYDGEPETSFNMTNNFNNIDIINHVTNSYNLVDIINQDISTASSNGYIDLQDTYSWSTQSNFNNGFTFDTDIYYDLDLYYLQDNKVFNFANGWQSTLGELSNLSFLTNIALADLIADFNTFGTLNFNGDFLHILKTIGLAIANIFNVIISLSELIVAPLIDMVSIIVLLITKSSFFWTFT